MIGTVAKVAALGAGSLALDRLLYGPEKSAVGRSADALYGLLVAPEDYVDEQAKQAGEALRKERLQRFRREQLVQAMRVSLMKLQQTDPKMYQELLVGRRLPIDAMVFGGSKTGVDALARLGYNMVTAGGTPQSPDVAVEMMS